MTLSETLTIIALVIVPIGSVIITIWYQNRKEQRDQKRRTFFTLVALRDSMPIPYDFVTALNTIDIVFHDDSKVLAAWKKYYQNLNSDNSPANLKARLDLKLDLLYEMAQALGYTKWRQTEMGSYYQPVAYLKKSNRFYDKLEAQQNFEESLQDPEKKP